jgi:hypothetical protein
MGKFWFSETDFSIIKRLTFKNVNVYNDEISNVDIRTNKYNSINTIRT